MEIISRGHYWHQACFLIVKVDRLGSMRLLNTDGLATRVASRETASGMMLAGTPQKSIPMPNVMLRDLAEKNGCTFWGRSEDGIGRLQRQHWRERGLGPNHQR